MHTTAMSDYECLNCYWVNAHILDETIVVDNGKWALKSSLYLEQLNERLWGICDLPRHVYVGHVGFRFAVFDGSISLSHLRSLLLKMWV